MRTRSATILPIPVITPFITVFAAVLAFFVSYV
jgi:hypothetical protein